MKGSWLELSRLVTLEPLRLVPLGGERVDVGIRPAKAHQDAPAIPGPMLLDVAFEALAQQVSVRFGDPAFGMRWAFHPDASGHGLLPIASERPRRR